MVPFIHLNLETVHLFSLQTYEEAHARWQPQTQLKQSFIERCIYFRMDLETMTCFKTTARISPRSAKWTLDHLGVGRSGQASSVIGALLAALLLSPLKLLTPSPVGVATMTAEMYCVSRYATDLGVRTDVIKAAVEDLAVNLG